MFRSRKYSVTSRYVSSYFEDEHKSVGAKHRKWVNKAAMTEPDPEFLIGNPNFQMKKLNEKDPRWYDREAAN